MDYDFVIVGQGIGGSVLADHLIEAGFKTLVFGNSDLSNSSRVAGGMYNPITGRKMTKTWKADFLFDYLEKYYVELESRLDSKFLHEMSIYRPFWSIEELNEWMGKSAEEIYTPYIDTIYSDSPFTNHVNDDFGGLLLKRSGYMDTNLFLDGFKTHLLRQNAFRDEIFDVNGIEIVDGKARYGDISATKIIFADGQLLRENTFFNWLPLRPVKGELLLIRVEEPIDVIYNRGVFVIPLGNGICKVGSTYDHQNLNNIRTEEAKIELTRKLTDLVKFPFEVIDQKAGVRPATKDRKPFVGLHPKFDQIGIFNGLGTKGVSLAPFFANQFVNSLTKGADLDPEVDISRFFSLY